VEKIVGVTIVVLEIVVERIAGVRLVAGRAVAMGTVGKGTGDWESGGHKGVLQNLLLSKQEGITLIHTPFVLLCKIVQF
jgi:hypothetical protein